ncbi:hypothetical protein GGR70_000943 [Xanthomonas campestris]|uniref:hypothetical protein n=1 Tax=Xanthomonas campestris TaxID=339 RepID=UPI002169E652|nr:hypothetical protein [Xanthomonas campestris]MCS3846008.1 hypothetical protein [Xanthomonas campestris]
MFRLFQKWHAIAVLSISLVACQQSPPPDLVREGGCSPNQSIYLKQTPSIDGRITYCERGDASTGEITTMAFPAGTRRVTVMMAGYPSTKGIRVLAVAADGSFSAALKADNVGDSWKSVTFQLPAEVQAHAFYLRLIDDATATFGWAGLGIDRTSLATRLTSHALPMVLAIMAAHLWLVLTGWLLPRTWSGPARALCAVLMLGAASGCVVASYIATPTLGEIIAYGAAALPLLALPLRLRRGRASIADAITLHRLFSPSFLLALLVLWIGLYPFSWDGQDWQMVANRWRNLPMDSWLPLTFAEMVSAGRLDVPMIGDWLSSDRPPLQSGLYLLFFHSWLPHGGLIYQALSTWAQALVLVPLLVLAGTLPQRSQRTAIVFALALSPLVLLNGLFVWPKLFAATFCAIFHIALFGRSSIAKPTRWSMAGLAAALAMLSHGGALFVLVGSTAAFLLLKRGQALLVLIKTGILAVAAYLPWVAYQRLIDPPGDRLLKWHFAGHVPVTQDSFLHVLRAAYADLGLGQWLAGRASNLNSLMHGSFTFFGDAAALFWNRSPAAIATVVENSFFYGAYSMWFASPLWLLPCVVYAFVKRRNLRPVRFPSDLALAAALSFLFWILVIYEPGQTVIHQGAYFSFLMSMLVILLMLAQCFPPALYAVVALNVAVAALAYAFDRPFEGMSSAIHLGATLALTGGLLAACGRASPETIDEERRRC